MKVHDPFLFRQLQLIQKVIQDEVWLEGERRGGAVSPDDPAVRENVCRVILRIGKEMREWALRGGGGFEAGRALAPAATITPVRSTDQPAAA